MTFGFVEDYFVGDDFIDTLIVNEFLDNAQPLIVYIYKSLFELNHIWMNYAAEKLYLIQRNFDVVIRLYFVSWK